MTPEEDAKLRELALSLLTKRTAGEGGPPEIVITYRKHDDYERFISKIAELEKELQSAHQQMGQLAMYAEENFKLYDQLRQAYRDMSAAGLDVSYISAIRTKRLK